ncbi:Aspartate/methionine/tyrosine aminotransferase [Granulicella rosea]|uniref:alanine transaminase n=1 Tax=Granulicella rosea TaxID=474952 RepID=A0A239H9L5_9BACT|nr:pyridoxal phosphate-dependent aminotransferase [Granulicella rosea]SNS78089.1 Aspartate/methionine/tyrosine aminotransferase [Granulicella rosea]
MKARFSTRTNWDTRESALAEEVRHARASGRRIHDLTLSNPTACGFAYDEAAVLGALAQPAAMLYDPDPRGMRVAREAVAAYYADHDAQIDPDDVILTTSTSEAYSYLFRLLCDAGDEVLVAQPSYPLFDFLADLDDVRLKPYPLFYDFGWWIDFAALEAAIGPRTRAVLLVHPNNPTGHATRALERTRLEELCAWHGLALIVDEVFVDYGLDGPIDSFAQGPHAALTFVVSGLSKICGLPQMKAAWLAAFGPEAVRRGALGRLEIVADTFLSMNAPVQLAMPAWLRERQGIQEHILERVRANLELLTSAGFEVLTPEAGWCAVVRLPDLESSASLLVRLIAEFGVVVHSGSFYGMRERSRVVISLLGPLEEFRAGIMELRRAFEPN